MKNKLIIFSSFLVVVFALLSCEKDENKIYYEGGTPPVLTASATSITMEPGGEANTALILNWSNPEYKFTTGINSQDVTYTIEIDTLGGNFNSKNKFSTVIAKDLSKTFTVGELNGILGNSLLLQLAPRRNYTIQMRVISSIGSSVKLTSNVISFTTRPFAPPPKVEPPTDGTLWMTGDAAPSGWSNPLPNPYDGTQKFTKISNTLYELVVALPGGGGYKLIQQPGNWGTQYHMLQGGTWEGGDFEKKDADPQFPGPPTAGTYKITVNFQIGKFTVVKQ